MTSPLLLALSPDGRNLVATVEDAGEVRLWLRPLERITGTFLRGTENGGAAFWSPDGRRIGFFADRKLKVIDVAGAPPQTLADTPQPRGGTWGRNGIILYAPGDGPLFRIAASGGQAVRVTELDQSRGEISHRLPRFLPDGNHFLYLVVSSKPDVSGIYVRALDSAEAKRLVPATSMAEFAPPDMLLFVRDGTLLAQRFDTSRLELTGEPFQIAENVAVNPLAGLAGFSVSSNGSLAYRTGGASAGRRLTWLARSGTAEGYVSTPGGYENVELNPDGTRLAVFRPDGGGDIWIVDIERGTNTRFTFDAAVDRMPVWSPDGARIAFVSNRKNGVFDIYAKASNLVGADQLLLESPNNKSVTDWSPDGRFILYDESNPKTRRDLWAAPVSGDRKPMSLLETPADEYAAAFSPDGRWIAYVSDEGGSPQVYVQGFPEPRGKWQVSTGITGTYPRWSHDGKEIFYDGTGELMAVDVSATASGDEFRPGTPRELFTALRGVGVHNFDVSPDGRRFMVISEGLETSSAPIVVVLNWMSGIAR